MAREKGGREGVREVTKLRGVYDIVNPYLLRR
jgi:hypothetical protein